MTKTLSFTKRPKSLDKHPETLCDRIRVGSGEGSLVFTMSDFMQINGHDDSLPYQAVLLVNGMKLCDCFNDGWGGTTELKFGQYNYPHVESIESYINNYQWSYQKIKFNLELTFIADILAQTWSCKK